MLCFEDICISYWANISATGATLYKGDFISKLFKSSMRTTTFQGYLIYSNLVIHGIIPLVLLILLNIAIYRQVDNRGPLK